MTTVTETGTRRGPRTRADALRNRERIVAAAREIFVEFGPGAPLDEIARRAGIGNATLYRHFADRRALVHDVVLSVMIRTADQAEAVATQEADPFTALRRFAHAAVDERVGALCGMLVGDVDKDAPDVTVQRDRLQSAVEGLMERAREAGQLRGDVTVRDLIVALAQLSRPLPGMDCPDTGEAAHRFLRVLLDGLHTAAPSQPPATETALEAPRPHRVETIPPNAR